MIIITSDPDRLAEPNFQDFIIYDDGEVDVRIMGPKGAYEYARYVLKGRWAEAEEIIKRDPEWAYFYAFYIVIPNMVDAIIDGINNNAELINKLLNYIQISSPTAAPAPTQSGPLEGELIVFTGKIEKLDEQGKRYTRPMMEETAKKNGAMTASKVNSNTTMLVQADVNSNSSKTAKAKKLGCKIVSEKDFWDIVG